MNEMCPSCLASKQRIVETVPVSALAAAWAEEKTHGDGIDAQRLHAYIHEDLGAEEVSFRQCQECGLEIASPMRSWSAPHYPQTKHILGFDHQATLADLAKQPPRRLLDIGCADGQFLEAAKAFGHQVAGIDFTIADIHSAQERGIDARLADVSEIGTAVRDLAPFDVVTLFQIIEHLNEPDEIFSQIASISKENTRLVVGCPSDRRYTRYYPHPNRIGRSDYWDYPPQHTLRWTPAALTTFLTRHSWQVESIVYEPFSVVGAAAHLTDLHARRRGWPPRGLARRTATLFWLAQMAGARLRGRVTGVRLLVTAKRSAA